MEGLLTPEQRQMLEDIALLRKASGITPDFFEVEEILNEQASKIINACLDKLKDS